MDAGPLDMLHNAGNQHLLAVADGVDFALFALHIMVDQHPLVRGYFRGGGQIAHQFRGVLDDFHSPPAQDIAGAHYYRIADILGHLQGFGYRSHRGSRRLGDTQAGQKLLELLPVGGYIDGFGAGA